MAFPPRGGGRGGGGFRGRGGSGPPRGGRGGFGDRGGGGGFRGGDRGRGRGGGRGGPPRGGVRGGSRGGFGGGSRGGRGGKPGGPKGNEKYVVEPHRHPGIFVARGGKRDFLITKNLVPGADVYGERRITLAVPASVPNGESSAPTDAEDAEPTKAEYREWNPFRSKLAAAVLGGVDDLYFGPGSKVLYLGAASGTSVSHVSDIVGSTGVVYAVEFSHRSGRDLLNLASRRTNIVPIVEDARLPNRYRMLVGMVDCIFADVAQPDQARIIGLNAHLFLKRGGGILQSIKANCIDSTKPPSQVFANEVQKLKTERIKPKEQLTLEPFERDHCIVVGEYLHSQ